MGVRNSTFAKMKTTEKVRKNRAFRMKHTVFVVEISGIEPLLFVCLKDSQRTKKGL